MKTQRITLELTEQQLTLLREALYLQEGRLLAIKDFEQVDSHAWKAARSDWRLVHNLQDQVGRSTPLPDLEGYTIHECRSCGDPISGTSDGRFGYDQRGPWRRIIGIDGRDAICPHCVSEPDCLDHLIADGYDNAAIAV